MTQNSSQGRKLLSLIYQFGFAVLVVTVQNYFSGTGWYGFLITAGIVFITFALIRFLPKPTAIAGVVEDTIRLGKEKNPYKVEHLVCFVPLYRDQRPKGEQISEEERQLAVENLDFETLDFEHSNFEPTIKAFECHQHSLKDVWLLETKGKKEGGSYQYSKVFEMFIQDKFSQLDHCRFHYGEDYRIPIEDEAWILQKTFRVVERVIKEIEGPWYLRYLKWGWWNRARVIVDVTTGVRTMLLGMVFAAMARGVKAEFVGAEYGDDGKPIPGTLVPMVMDFEGYRRSLG